MAVLISSCTLKFLRGFAEYERECYFNVGFCNFTQTPLTVPLIVYLVLVLKRTITNNILITKLSHT